MTQVAHWGPADFEALLESAPDAILLVDEMGKITLVNRQAEQLFGYTRQALLGEAVEALVPELRQQDRLHRAVYDDSPPARPMAIDLELNGRRKDGSEFPVEISLSPMQGQSGERFVITFVRDVTERKAAETQFRTLLESAPDAIVLADAAGRIVLANARTADLFGYAADELVGNAVELLVPEPRTRELGADLELYGRRKDGSEFPVEISLSPLASPDGTLVTTIIRDVTERKLAETERRAREAAEAAREGLSALLRDLDAIVWESETPGRDTFTFVSGRVEEILGYPLEPWTDSEGFWAQIVHPDDLDSTHLFFREAAAEREHHELVYRVLAADGRTVWVRDIVRVSTDAAGHTRVRGVMVDMTRQRELEGHLLQSQKMEAVGQLAGGIAHDFNNLLTVVRGYAQLLSARVADERAQQDLAAIIAAAERAAALAGQLLAFSRRAPRRAEVLDLNGVVRELDAMLRRLISEDIALVIDVPDHPIFIKADRSQLEQVLVNLVVNSRDALSGRGTIDIEVGRGDVAEKEAAQRGLRAGPYGLLVVTDTGVGMDEDTLGRIFEPFFTTKEVGKGTGLGLSTVYGIVEQTGGRIEVESAKGRGTKVTVYLPGTPSAGDEPSPDDEEPEATILLAEDEPSLRTLACSILEGARWRVLEARDGREALAIAAQYPGIIDLLLTDVVMPELNGPELAQQLRSLRPELRVLYMSGYADSTLMRASERGAPLVRKPFDPDELTTRVRTMLDAG